MPQAALAPRYGLPRFVTDWPELWKERFEERAAHMEFDGNLPRSIAEENAERDIRQQFHKEQVKA
jgi:hypothetical protein